MTSFWEFFPNARLQSSRAAAGDPEQPGRNLQGPDKGHELIKRRSPALVEAHLLVLFG